MKSRLCTESSQGSKTAGPPLHSLLCHPFLGSCLWWTCHQGQLRGLWDEDENKLTALVSSDVPCSQRNSFLPLGMATQCPELKPYHTPHSQVPTSLQTLPPLPPSLSVPVRFYIETQPGGRKPHGVHFGEDEAATGRSPGASHLTRRHRPLSPPGGCYLAHLSVPNPAQTQTAQIHPALPAGDSLGGILGKRQEGLLPWGR